MNSLQKYPIEKDRALFVCGIDPGTHTGIAVFDRTARKLIVCETMAIHRALEYVHDVHFIKHNQFNKAVIFVRFEDSRQRVWFGKASREKLQGAGSIKRDCKIWEDFLTDYQIPFQMVKPAKGATKWNADYFKRVTGWQGRTDEHNRDAGVLCFGY